ncbi:MAG: group II intron reverse transcriptase/maturase [Promethearchaeota archaeon]
MSNHIELTRQHAAEWKAIDWANHQKHVKHLQERIFCATRNQKWKQVKNLQKLLVRSYSAHAISVRKVTQENKGKNTAGIDNFLCNTPRKRLQLILEIQQMKWHMYKCQPVKRVYIPKPNGDKRPLGIPTIKDRVLQMVVKFALEPEWEAKFEPNSYGFRPGRRCQDAIRQIWETIKVRKNRKSSAWILDADISKCFDNIDHGALLNRIPVFKQVIRQWLKAGIIEFGSYRPSSRGTPQGGIISPLLANIALDGMERLFGVENSRGNYLPPARRSGKNRGVSLIRYADDFVVTAPSRAIIETHILPKLQEFLITRGLQLNQVKTRIVHRTEGFDFLGFTVRQFEGQPRPICLAYPSKKAVKRHLNNIKEVLSQMRAAKTKDVISRLNPIIRGWANYYRYSNAKTTFNTVDYRIWKMLWAWCKRRHSKKSITWVRKKYFHTIGTRKWVFATKEGDSLLFTAKFRAQSQRYAKVKGYNSPYDPILHQYWDKRARGKTQYQKWGPYLSE